MKNAKKRAPSISIRWQLMFFIGAMTLLTVGLIWGIITYALAPKYNATIRQNLTNKASAITAIFDQTDSEISSRDFGVLQLDDDFWTALGQTFSDTALPESLREHVPLPAAREQRLVQRGVRVQPQHPPAHHL